MLWAAKVLAQDEDKDRWKALCGPAVLDCLRSLAEEDPDALRLSRAAFAAIELGLPAKEVHTVVPSRLRFGRAKNLFLDLHKRGLGPEGAARLEFPSSLRDLDLDLTRRVELASEKLQERLATGARVVQLQLSGERLQFQRLEGAGPDTGWVSLTLKDKALLKPESEERHDLSWLFGGFPTLEHIDLPEKTRLRIAVCLGPMVGLPGFCLISILFL
eukprot:symbB.v1.2.016803.t3/scaffold1292.1/size223628/1